MFNFRKKKAYNIDSKLLNTTGNLALAAREILRIETNPEKALRVASTMLLALSKQDITIDEIQYQIKSMITALLDLKQLNQMINMGLRGVTRKANITDWDLLFSSLNKNSTQITGVLDGY